MTRFLRIFICSLTNIMHVNSKIVNLSLYENLGTINSLFCLFRSPSFHVEWNVIKYPFKHINARFQPVSSRGAIVTNYIRSGQIVAVAMNQNRPALTSLLFVSPLTDTVLVSNLKGCGVRDKGSHRGR